MRLFIAVNFNDEIKSRIRKIQEQLKLQSLRGNFTRPENLHLTLVFLGETPEEKLKVLSRILEGIQATPFEITFDHSGCFTHSRKELWWIGAASSNPGLDILRNIHSRLLHTLSEEGFRVDRRPFNAHVTLGREIKHTGPIFLDCPEITILVNRISLMESQQLRSVLNYAEVLARDL